MSTTGSTWSMTAARCTCSMQSQRRHPIVERKVDRRPSSTIRTALRRRQDLRDHRERRWAILEPTEPMDLKRSVRGVSEAHRLRRSPIVADGRLYFPAPTPCICISNESAQQAAGVDGGILWRRDSRSARTRVDRSNSNRSLSKRWSARRIDRIQSQRRSTRTARNSTHPT